MSDQNNAAARAAAVAEGTEGRNQRPEFDARWFLKDLKVVSSLETFASEAWDTAEAKVQNDVRRPVVVVMDTPLDATHPNLLNSIDKARMRDFSVLNEGVFPVPAYLLSDSDFNERVKLIKEPTDQTTGKLTEAQIKGLDRTSWAKVNTKASASILSDLLDPTPDTASLSRTEPTDAAKRRNFAKYVPGAHGTAVAGLIAATPSDATVEKPASLGASVQGPVENTVHLAYAGINPFAKIVPVSLTAAPYPDMVLGALRYVEALKPDVVVIAAAWADAVDLGPLTSPNDGTWPLEQNENDISFSEADLTPEVHTDHDCWKEVTGLLSEISRTSVVLCAAGNVDSRTLVYPAILCERNDNEIWAVTACDETSESLSYAPPIVEGRRMIKTLSTQLPRSDREKTVHDNFAYLLPELRKESSDYKPINPRDVITLDPLGRQGYNPTETPSLSGDDSDNLLEIGSLFARFSGTSAATAVAGGLVSLAMMTEELALTGKELDPDVLFDLDQARLFSHGKGLS
ncbi:S8 family serine peptidase [Rhodophyticola sp. CCM32]|uniref:S8 family serine peptidase n=1 Tax=Rhodophyticola sp. CCM32 TaxID=2916397 RepID=UPI00143E07D3|nr:S8 family serine peptidase [Rhodophyticola sp. CCM32]